MSTTSIKLSRRQRSKVERNLKRLPSIRCSIELERHIFSPGQVVKGQVRLKVPLDIHEDGSEPLCRGVYLGFLGQSAVVWVQGSGDSEVTYRDQTVHQNEFRTLLGSYHKTPNTRTSGLRDGWRECIRLMINSCESKNSQRLVVQVVEMVKRWTSFQFNVVGEVRFAAGELVGAKEARAYPLLRRNTSVELSAEWEREDSDCLVLMVHKIKGFPGKMCYVRVCLEMSEEQEEIMVQRSSTKGRDDNREPLRVALPLGETIFPFQIQLQDDVPSSANWKVKSQGKASIEYWIVAQVDCTGNRGSATETGAQTARAFLIVLQDQNNLLPEQLRPFRTEQLNQLLHSCHCCCIRFGKRSGPVSVRLALQRLSFAPGEALELRGSQVSNESNTSLPIRIVLRCHLEQCHKKSDSDKSVVPKHHTRFDFVLLDTQVDGNQMLNLDAASVRIPAVYPTFDPEANVGSSGDAGEGVSLGFSCLSWKYTLELRAGGRVGDWATGVFCQTGIHICATPPIPTEDESNVVGTLVKAERSKPIQFFADVDELESFSRQVLEGDDGEGVAMDFRPLQYESVVKSFNPDAQSLPELDLDSRGSMIMQTIDADQMSQSHSAREISSSVLSDLLMSLDRTLDKLTLVREWVQANLLATQQLSPRDFSDILSKVSFSLERLPILKELMSAFGGTPKTLTCQHILAVFELMQEKAEVVRIMAPHVQDPENKDTVLDAMVFRLERESAEALFASL